jgi:periplasmic divalent cation tolerance protein
MTDKIVVFSACASSDEARRIARKLVDARLAACVTVTPGVRSFYRWKGVVEEAEECMLVIKSSHTYEVPEVVAVAIVAGAPNYLAWLDKEMDVPSV